MRRRFQRLRRSYNETMKRSGALCVRTSQTLTLWNLRGFSQLACTLLEVLLTIVVSAQISEAAV